MLCNLIFANNTILSCFFFFLIIDLYFLTPTVIEQIFNLTVEIAIIIGIPTKKQKQNLKHIR